MSTHKFDDLIEGLTNAVMHASSLAEEQHLSLIRRFFNDVDGKRIAKTVTMKIPSYESEGQPEVDIDVPLISLVPQTSMVLDQVEIEFDAVLESLEGEDRNKQLQMSIGGAAKKKAEGSKVKVKVVMKGTEPPEGLAKVNDHILKHIP